MGRRKTAERRRWRSTGWVPDERAARRRQLQADARPDEDDFVADRHADVDAEAFELGDYYGEDHCA